MILPLAMGHPASLTAQATQRSAISDSLFQTIAGLDSAMFDAYNRCDLEKLERFFTDDLEFYHDQTGLSRGREALIKAVRSNICGKVHRDLVPGTLGVYPLRGYGAVATGVHRFCDARTHTHCDSTSGPARFVTLWERVDGGWRISRVISYDHH